MQVDEAVIQNRDCLRVCRGAIGKVDGVEVARGRTRVAIANHWIDIADVEGSTFVPSIGCLSVCRLTVLTPMSLPKRVRLAPHKHVSESKHAMM